MALARGAYKMLYVNGWRNMKILDGGIPGWIEKGYPTQGTEPTLRIERHE
jgi:3-mercaptopyruvate sulfurtransferase SseA